MAVSTSYLAKVRRAVRINSDSDFDTELVDIIEQCRRDLETVGVTSEKTTDETDSLILGAVRSFARWKFGLDTDLANREDYFLQRGELRRKRDYKGYTITFTVTDGASAIADAEIEFNGETKETDTLGQAVFYYVSAGVNQEYIVSADGFTTQEVDLDVTASMSVAVVMT